MKVFSHLVMMCYEMGSCFWDQRNQEIKDFINSIKTDRYDKIFSILEDEEFKLNSMIFDHLVEKIHIESEGVQNEEKLEKLLRLCKNNKYYEELLVNKTKKTIDDFKNENFIKPYFHELHNNSKVYAGMMIGGNEIHEERKFCEIYLGKRWIASVMLLKSQKNKIDEENLACLLKSMDLFLMKIENIHNKEPWDSRGVKEKVEKYLKLIKNELVLEYENKFQSQNKNRVQITRKL